MDGNANAGRRVGAAVVQPMGPARGPPVAGYDPGRRPSAVLLFAGQAEAAVR
ncbi:MAG: hypothetical protein ACRDRF_10740 [Pseudonocardiaceae bacterium]